MMIVKKTAAEKRAELRESLKSGKLLQYPGAFNPLVAMTIELYGFHGVYVSGAVMSNSLGLPDIGLTTLSEVTSFAASIAKVTSVPAIMDVDTGFGEVMNMARTIQEIEYAGISGCHIEDQVNPKRCGHLDGKQLVSSDDMSKKVKAAVDARSDNNLLIIARTDARSVEGLESAISRAKAYVDAGADMIFPEALQDEKEFEIFRKEINVPLLANMTEFGKSKLLSKTQLEKLGYNLVIYPVTLQRLAMGIVEEGLKEIQKAGTQEGLTSRMQTRSRLYEVLEYKEYNKFDESVMNFKLKPRQ